MKKYKLHLSHQIERDLSDIIFYIQQLGAYDSTVLSFLDKVYSAFKFLQSTPLLDRSLESKIAVQTNMRFYLIEQHIIFYEIADDVIEVTRVLSEKKDYLRILGF